MVADPAVGGMGDPLINVTHRLIFHEIQRIYQRKQQERQVLGTQKRPAQLSLARRGQRHKWTGHKTFRRKSIPGNTSMNQEKRGYEGPHTWAMKIKANGTHPPCDGDAPHDRVSGR